MKEEFEEHNLWVELTKTPRPHEVVPLPRKKPDGEPIGNIIMVILTSEENMIIKKEADDRLKQLYKEAPPSRAEKANGYDSLYNDFCSLGILYRACKRVDDINKPFFKNKESIPKILTMDEIAVLCNHYYTMLFKYGPQLQNMSEDDVLNWTKRIQEDVGVDPSFLLNLVSSEAVKILAISLANQLRTLQTAKLSSSEQPENGVTNSENMIKETL